jgi:hypothetical protein
MFSKIIRSLSFVFCLAVFGNTLFAQALFRVGSATPTAVDIGQTELTGSITMTVVSGTTVAAPFVITYSAPITNNSAADISIQGIGTLSFIAPAPELNRTANAIIVHIPAGGTANSSIIISGVRVAIAGLGFSHVTATIEGLIAGGNSIIVGETTPVVIGSIADPFSISQSEPPISYGVESNGNASITIREGFLNAFAGSSGIGGQTAPTQIRVNPFPSIPDGVQLTFGAAAISPETGATLTTQSGLPETVPRANGSTDVIYVFASASESSVTIESFQLSITMTILEPQYTPFIIQFQATIIPIGLAVPTSEFPSTAIPRYLERTVPDESELMSGSKEFFFPFPAANEEAYTGIALTNPQDYRVLVTLTAYSDNGTMIAGTGINNPVTVTLPRKGQYAKVASEIFGQNFNASTAGTIRAAGRTEELAGFYIIGDLAGPKLDGSTGLIEDNGTWYLPLIFRQGDSPYNLLEIYNPGAVEASVTLMLMNADGIQISSSTQIIPASGTLKRDIQNLFGVNLSTFQGGYIKGRSGAPIVVHNTFGNTDEFSVLNAQTIDVKRFYDIPHFAAGGTYVTELTLVNVDTTNTAEMTLTLLDDSGASISMPGNPLSLAISAQKQLTSNLADLFPSIGPELLTGSIRIEVRLRRLGPFATGPSLIGAVRFQASDGSASTAIPLVLNPSSDFIYSHVAQNPDYFTGITLLNANSQVSNFRLDVYDTEGAPVGSYSSALQPGERISKLLYELVPASGGQVGGYVRIISDASLTSFAFFGKNDLKTLSAIPPQNPR